MGRGWWLCPTENHCSKQFAHPLLLEVKSVGESESGGVETLFTLSLWVLFPFLLPNTHPCINQLTLVVNHTSIAQSVIKQGRVRTRMGKSWRKWERPRWLQRPRRSRKLQRRRRSIISKTTSACARSTLWSLTSKAWGILWLKKMGLFIQLCPLVWSLLRRWRRRWRKFRESSGGTDGWYWYGWYGSHLSRLDNKGGVSMQVPGLRRIELTKPLSRKTGGQWWAMDF